MYMYMYMYTHVYNYVCVITNSQGVDMSPLIVSIFQEHVGLVKLFTCVYNMKNVHVYFSLVDP